MASECPQLLLVAEFSVRLRWVFPDSVSRFRRAYISTEAQKWAGTKRHEETSPVGGSPAAQGHGRNMVRQITRYGISATAPLPFERAVERTREELAKEGFGILTEIDIAATLKKKLDVDFRPYVILGACNPSLAHQALQAERDIGLLLPCNVIVYAADEEGKSVVAAMDPVEALALTGNDSVGVLAEEVRERLQRVLAALERG